MDPTITITVSRTTGQANIQSNVTDPLDAVNLLLKVIEALVQQSKQPKSSILVPQLVTQ